MNQETLNLITNSIKSIQDYPKPGILFRDVTSLMEVPEAYRATIALLAEKYQDQGITKVIGTEARGFLFGAPLALALGVAFVPVRKPGKLPREVIAESYELEYGKDTLEIHKDAIVAGDKVLLVDDLLATGGTIEATTNLVRRLGGDVNDAAFVINLPDIGGEARLQGLGLNVYSICDFPGH
ncbi:adenine phosphoribosyltransferase [Photobacterium toruni]|uniref:Adenine phosphoribosyltransferase n=1 Tax=Photobacterium toruni TaxID=1935446 RepID=A0A1T4KFU1_9GAMM|nr:adenine phosphoribosyltransferase [Photobacterium toruni]MEC6814021.1 adenine phosphoribosyltransferase [Photobacterium toruni]MEC6832425.1 adenine phosphoribosyltransferase [Photobacterium toruni]SJZ41235.1 Adenine phosphoribosyltransferase [Photobacterium toruni]